MNRRSQSISLVLIGSALTLPGCYREPAQCQNADPSRPGEGCYTSSHGGSTRGGRMPVYIGSGRSSSTSAPSHGSTSVGGTSRGGFGSTGHAAGAHS